MNWKLQEYMDSRIPLMFRKRDGVVYLQSQIEVAKENGLCDGYYCIFEDVKINSVEEVGRKVYNALRRFENYADLTIAQFHEITQMTREEYEIAEDMERRKSLHVESVDKIDIEFISCMVKYDINTLKYSFSLSWIKKHGRGFYFDSSPSTGEKRIAVFDTPLEFYLEDITYEKLGAMVLEALDRSEHMGNVVNRQKTLRKRITLLNEARISVLEPKNKHFVDEEDGHVAEAYQLYSYYPNEEAEEPAAMYYLAIAEELECDMSVSNIQKVWETMYGTVEQWEVKEQETGIFTLRVEMKNKEHHRISYLLQMEEDLLLECTMDVMQPNRRKKTDAKLVEMFEKFVMDCKWD